VFLAGKELKEARQKTTVHNKTLNPVFKEILSFYFSKKEPLVHTVSMLGWTSTSATHDGCR
jgi:hypothetical protein